MLTVTDPAASNFTFAGETVQDAPAGGCEQVSATVNGQLLVALTVHDCTADPLKPTRIV